MKKMRISLTFGALLLVAGCGGPQPLSVEPTPIPTLIPATLPPEPTVTPTLLSVEPTRTPTLISRIGKSPISRTSNTSGRALLSAYPLCVGACKAPASSPNTAGCR